MQSDHFTTPTYCYEPPPRAKGRDKTEFLIACLIFGGLIASGSIGLVVLLMVVSP